MAMIQPSRLVAIATAFVVSCLLTQASLAECSRAQFYAAPDCFNLELDGGEFTGDARHCAHPRVTNCYKPRVFTVNNECEHPVKVRIVVNHGDDVISTFTPGQWSSGALGSANSSHYYRWWTACKW